MVTPQLPDVSDPGAVTSRVVDTVRDWIMRGKLVPGTPLREPALASELDISRNTLRVAMRLLAAEGLVVVQRFKGATVKSFTVDEIRDIWTVRRTLELRSVDAANLDTRHTILAMESAVQHAEATLREQSWVDVSTASLEFHQTLVALLESPRLDDFFRTIIAQLRLAFATTTDRPDLSRTWVQRDREVCDLLRAGCRASAAAALRSYLDEAETMVLELVFN